MSPTKLDQPSTRLSVRLSDETLKKITVLAKATYRTPSQQAAFMLERQLKVMGENK